MTNYEITEDSWQQLGQKLPMYGRLNAKTVRDDSTLLLAVNHEGYRQVLLKIKELKQAVNDNRSRGLTISGKNLAIKEEETPYIVVACTDKDGHKEFNMVATDIFQRVNSGIKPDEAVLKTLEKWRKFWGGASRQILTEEHIKGLFGELWFLLFWLLPRDVQWLRKWVGPLGTRHDFEFRNTAIEAKTTASIRGHIHRIHGIDQLDPPVEGELLFFSLRLRQENTAMNNLPMLIERITSILNSDQELSDLFESNLATIGYSPVFAEQYAEYRFRIIDERLYHVVDGFPKLSVDSLSDGVPVGVERIDYEINLESAQNYLIAKLPNQWDAADLE